MSRGLVPDVMVLVFFQPLRSATEDHWVLLGAAEVAPLVTGGRSRSDYLCALHYTFCTSPYLARPRLPSAMLPCCHGDSRSGLADLAVGEQAETVPPRGTPGEVRPLDNGCCRCRLHAWPAGHGPPLRRHFSSGRYQTSIKSCLCAITLSRCPAPWRPLRSGAGFQSG